MLHPIRKTALFVLAGLLLVCAAAVIAGRIWPGDVILARALPANFMLLENHLVAIDVPRRVHTRIQLPGDDTALSLTPLRFDDESRHRVRMIAVQRLSDRAAPRLFTLDLRTHRLTARASSTTTPTNTQALEPITGQRVDGPGAYQAVYNESAVQIITAETGAVRHDIRTPTPARGVVWSPDGAYLLVLRGEAGEGRLIDTIATADGTLTRIPVRERVDFRLSVSDAQWSPDGSTLLIHGHRVGAAGRGVVFLVAPDGDDLRLLSDWVNWPPAWLPDAPATLLYSRGQPMRRRALIRHHVPTGAETALYRGDIEAFSVAPDGTRVLVQEGVPVFQRGALREKRVRLLDLRGGGLVTLYRDVYELYDMRYIPAR